MNCCVQAVLYYLIYFAYPGDETLYNSELRFWVILYRYTYRYIIVIIVKMLYSRLICNAQWLLVYVFFLLKKYWIIVSGFIEWLYLQNISRWLMSEWQFRVVLFRYTYIHSIVIIIKMLYSRWIHIWYSRQK